MPTDHQELQGWISDHNCDLRNALEFSDSAVGSLLCHGTARSRVVGRSHGWVDQISVDGTVDRRVIREIEDG